MVTKSGPLLAGGTLVLAVLLAGVACGSSKGKVGQAAPGQTTRQSLVGGSHAGYRKARPWYRKGMRTLGFQSPTGNVRCGLGGGQNAPLLCKTLNNGNAVNLHIERAVDEKVTATIPTEPTLAYGEVWSSTNFFCWSRFTGVTCRSLHSTNGFEIDRAGVRALRWPAQVLDASGFALGGSPTDKPLNASADTNIATAPAGRFCYGGYTIPAIHLAPVHIPGETIPATTINGVHLPAQYLPPVDLPGQTIQAQHVGRTCFPTAELHATTVRVSNYRQVDPLFNPGLTSNYWNSSTYAAMPDFSAPGFGELNAAGFPKDQYVRPYFRSDGTFVNGYWRNSPSDGLPTCDVINC